MENGGHARKFIIILESKKGAIVDSIERMSEEILFHFGRLYNRSLRKQ